MEGQKPACTACFRGRVCEPSWREGLGGRGTWCKGRASVGLAYERFFGSPFGSGESQRLSTGGHQNDNVGCDASNAGCRVWNREVRRREAAPLKPKGAAPAQKQKQIPRAAAFVMTTGDACGVAQGTSRTRLLVHARLRCKAQALLAPEA